MIDTLRQIVRESLEMATCVVEPVELDLFKVSVPKNSPIASVLEAESIVYVACSVYEEDVVAGYEPIRYVVPGSYYLERLLSYCCENGVVGDVCHPALVNPLDSRAILAKAGHLISKTREHMLVRSESKERRCVTFYFVIELRAVEERRELRAVSLDIASGRCLREPRSYPSKSGSLGSNQISASEIRNLYSQALSEISSFVQNAITKYAEDHKHERKKAESVILQARKQEICEFDRSASEQRKRGVSEVKIEKERKELLDYWRRRAEQVQHTYSAEGATVKLVAATRESRPFQIYVVHSECNDGRTLSTEWAYDLYLPRLLMPTCHSCGAVRRRFVVGDGTCTHVLCEDCVVTLNCGHRICGECGKPEYVCAVCEKTLCPECALESDCGHPVCTDCQGELVSCRACGKKYCPTCINQGIPCDCLEDLRQVLILLRRDIISKKWFRRILVKGRKTGFLTFDSIYEMLPNDGTMVMEFELLLTILEEQGVVIVHKPDSPDEGVGKGQIDLIVRTGREKGYLTYDEIYSMLHYSATTPDRFDMVTTALAEAGVEIMNDFEILDEDDTVDAVRMLVDKGSRDGQVSYGSIYEILPDEALTSRKLDLLLTTLRSEGIEILDESKQVLWHD